MDYKSLQRHLDTIHDQLALPCPALGPELSALSPGVPHLVQCDEHVLCWKEALSMKQNLQQIWEGDVQNPQKGTSIPPVKAPQVSHKHPTPRPLSVLDMAVDAGLGSPS